MITRKKLNNGATILEIAKRPAWWGDGQYIVLADYKNEYVVWTHVDAEGNANGGHYHKSNYAQASHRYFVEVHRAFTEVLNYETAPSGGS